MTKVSQIHDHFLKIILEKPEDAGTMLRERLPEEVSVLLAPDPPELVEGSFVDGEFKDHFTDRLYKVRLLDGEDAFIYSLLEHKSEPVRKVAWQLHRYITRILEQWEKENPKWEKLPAIISIVIYHGQEEWLIPDEFQALIASNEVLRPYLMNFRFVLVNLKGINDSLLSRSLRLRIGFLLLKYVFRKDEQKGILEMVAVLLRDVPELLYPAMFYIIHAYDMVDEPTIRAFIRVAKPEEETKMMSQYAQAIQKEDRIEMLLDLLAERFGSVPDWVRSKLAQADLDTLKNWSKRIFRAEKIEEIFQ